MNVSICLLTKDENRYLNEWLDWHICTGFEHFFIYDNGSAVPVSESINPEYKSMCTIVDWSGEHEHTQKDAYNNCLKNYGHLTKWMAFIDTDEFIRVIDGTNIQTFMRDYEGAAALAIRWIIYNANGQIHRDNQPVRERFRTTAEYPIEMIQHKCIVDPTKVQIMAPHIPVKLLSGEIVNEKHQEVTTFGNYDLPRERIVIDHYFTRSLEEWREKMARGSCDPYCSREFDWFWKMNPEMKQNNDNIHMEVI